MELSLLCPVEAVGEDGTPLALGGPRQRALLAYLLLHANRVVSAERLIEELWDDPPRDAHAALQNQVSRLRKALGDRVVTRAPGYLLRIEPGELDLDRFRTAVADAGSISDLAERSRVLREADALFRGTPLADVEAPFAAGEAAALDELRLAALEARVDADLERGRHAELVPELGALVARYPLRERLRGQHILALYRCGRQAEALEAYRDTRRILDEQLGLEPGPALRELERAILVHDPELALADVPPPPPAAAADVAPIVSEPEPSRRRALGVAFALVAVALGLAGVAAAIVFTRSPSSSPEPASAGPLPAAPAKRAASHHRAVVTHVVRAHVAKLTVAAPKTHPVAKHRAAAPRHAPAIPKRSVPASTTPAKTTPAAVKPKTKPKVTPNPPAQTTTAPATPVPPPAGPVTISDDFSESSPNGQIWNYSNGDGSGATASLENGRLVFTVPADAKTGGQYNMVGPVWGTRCRFDGDFDARVDFELLDWPAGAGAHLQLSVWVYPNVNSAAGRMTNQFSESYTGNVGNAWDQVDTRDMKGTLRVARVGGTLSTYYLSSSGWALIHSGSAPGQAMLGLQLFGMGNEWLHKQMRVALDNFVVAAPSSICP